jgi:hypothetical protein
VIEVGEMVEHPDFGIGKVVWINERRLSGHILIRPVARGRVQRLFGVTAKDTYVHHVRKLNALELMALEAS